MVGVGLVAIVLAQGVLAQGGPYGLTWHSIDGGGGAVQSSDGRFGLVGVIGQPDDTAAPQSDSGGQYTLSGGFLFGPAVPPSSHYLYLPLVLKN